MGEQKKDGRKIPRETLEQFRFRAIELRKEGWSVNDIAVSLDMHRGSVSRWLTKNRRGGRSAIKRRKAKGAQPKLNVEHKKEILSWIKRPAMELGFETPLWTCKRVQLLIKKKLGISIAVSNIWTWLQRWGLTSQTPERRALQCNEKEAARWLREDWPKIKAHARRWQAMLYFQDESGVSLTAYLGKTWAPRGKTPIVKVTGKRGGFCVSSAISPAGRLVFRIEKETVTAKVFIDFLKQILRQHANRKVVVIADQAKPHTAKEVRCFVEENKKRFAIYYLPSYSPHLNPDEHVWGHLKAQKLKAHQAQTLKEFKPLVLSKMRSIQRSPTLIKSFFYGPIVT